nr:MAG TPA_asm: portal protein, lambda family [Caudoviricetes sp.]
MNVFDRAVAAVAPVHAAKRAAARAALKIIDSGYGNYGANLTKKSLRGWEFYGGSAKEDIEDNIDILRQRSRDAYMGIPTASAALKTMRTNVIAGGLMPAPQIDAEFLGLTPEDAEKLQAQIVREFALWADTPVCDADRVDNFYKLQQLTFLSYAMNGDAIVLLPTKEQTGQPYSLRVRLVEADRVCSPDGFDRLVPCTVQGHDVHCLVQGVETDADGMVVAYWVCDRHPLASNAYTSGGPHWTRVEAYTKTTGRRNVLHVMNRERAGQRRGVPMLAPVLEALKQLGRYTDAEITAAVLSAMFTVFVKQGVASDARPFGEMLPPDMLIDAQDQSSIELGPGAILSLNPGEDVEFADPKHPNTGYDAYDHELANYIETTILDKDCSPAAVLGFAMIEGKKFKTSLSVPTIYKYIAKGLFLNLTQEELPRHGKKKHKYKKVKKNKSASRAPAGESIEQRPEGIDGREEFGHWEGDTVYSGKGKRKTTRALLTMTERKTRKEIIIAIPNRKAETVVKALDALERKLGARRFRAIFKSITFDNGTEFAAAEELERSCINKHLPRTKVYFCHPYSSWERGTNENTNGMIRRRFPKGTNFAAVTNAQITQAENWINNYPRKILGYKSSEIVFRECLRELGIAA